MALFTKLFNANYLSSSDVNVQSSSKNQKSKTHNKSKMVCNITSYKSNKYHHQASATNRKEGEVIQYSDNDTQSFGNDERGLNLNQIWCSYQREQDNEYRYLLLREFHSVLCIEVDESDESECIESYRVVAHPSCVINHFVTEMQVFCNRLLDDMNETYTLHHYTSWISPINLLVLNIVEFITQFDENRNLIHWQSILMMLSNTIHLLLTHISVILSSHSSTITPLHTMLSAFTMLATIASNLAINNQHCEAITTIVKHCIGCMYTLRSATQHHVCIDDVRITCIHHRRLLSCLRRIVTRHTNTQNVLVSVSNFQVIIDHIGIDYDMSNDSLASTQFELQLEAIRLLTCALYSYRSCSELIESAHCVFGIEHHLVQFTSWTARRFHVDAIASLTNNECGAHNDVYDDAHVFGKKFDVDNAASIPDWLDIQRPTQHVQQNIVFKPNKSLRATCKQLEQVFVELEHICRVVPTVRVDMIYNFIDILKHSSTSLLLAQYILHFFIALLEMPNDEQCFSSKLLQESIATHLDVYTLLIDKSMSSQHVNSSSTTTASASVNDTYSSYDSRERSHAVSYNLPVIHDTSLSSPHSSLSLNHYTFSHTNLIDVLHTSVITQILDVVCVVCTSSLQQHCEPLFTSLLDVLQFSCVCVVTLLRVCRALCIIIRCRYYNTVLTLLSLDAISRLLHLSLSPRCGATLQNSLLRVIEYILVGENSRRHVLLHSPSTVNTLFLLIRDSFSQQQYAIRLLISFIKVYDQCCQDEQQESPTQTHDNFIAQQQKIHNHELLTKFVELFSRVDNAAIVIMLVKGVHDIISFSSKMATLLCSQNIFLQLMSVLNKYEHADLCLLVLDVLQILIGDNKMNEKLFRATIGYDKLGALILRCHNDQLNDAVFSRVMHIALHEENKLSITNPYALKLLLHLITRYDTHDQMAFFMQLESLARSSSLNRLLMCRMQFLDDILSQFTSVFDSVPLQNRMLSVLRILARHSMNVRQLHAAFTLLRMPLCNAACSARIISCLRQTVTTKPYVDYFLFDGNHSGLRLSPIKQWPVRHAHHHTGVTSIGNGNDNGSGNGSGYTLCTAIRVESFDTHIQTSLSNRNTIYTKQHVEPRLFSALTRDGRGIQVFIRACAIVVRVCLARGRIVESSSSSSTTTTTPMLIQHKWSHIAIVHTRAGRFTRAELCVYVDGVIRVRQSLPYPKERASLTQCLIGTDEYHQHVFHGQMAYFAMYNEPFTMTQITSYHHHTSSSSSSSNYTLPNLKALMFGFHPRAREAELILNISESNELCNGNVYNNAHDGKECCAACMYAILLPGTYCCTTSRVHDALHSLGGISYLMYFFTQLEHSNTHNDDDGESEFIVELMRLISVLVEHDDESRRYMCNIGIGVIRYVIRHISPLHLSVNFVDALQNLISLQDNGCDAAALMFNVRLYLYTSKAVREHWLHVLETCVNVEPERCNLQILLDNINDLSSLHHHHHHHHHHHRDLPHSIVLRQHCFTYDMNTQHTTDVIVGTLPNDNEVNTIRNTLLALIVPLVINAERFQVLLRAILVLAVNIVQPRNTLVNMNDDCIALVNVFVNVLANKPIQTALMLDDIGGPSLLLPLLQSQCQSIRCMALQALSIILTSMLTHNNNCIHYTSHSSLTNHTTTTTTTTSISCHHHHHHRVVLQCCEVVRVFMQCHYTAQHYTLTSHTYKSLLTLLLRSSSSSTHHHHQHSILHYTLHNDCSIINEYNNTPRVRLSCVHVFAVIFMCLKHTTRHMILRVINDMLVYINIDVEAFVCSFPSWPSHVIELINMHCNSLDVVSLLQHLTEFIIIKLFEVAASSLRCIHTTTACHVFSCLLAAASSSFSSSSSASSSSSSPSASSSSSSSSPSASSSSSPSSSSSASSSSSPSSSSSLNDNGFDLLLHVSNAIVERMPALLQAAHTILSMNAASECVCNWACTLATTLEQYALMLAASRRINNALCIIRIVLQLLLFARNTRAYTQYMSAQHEHHTHHHHHHHVIRISVIPRCHIYLRLVASLFRVLPISHHHHHHHHVYHDMPALLLDIIQPHHTSSVTDTIGKHTNNMNNDNIIYIDDDDDEQSYLNNNVLLCITIILQYTLSHIQHAVSCRAQYEICHHIFNIISLTFNKQLFHMFSSKPFIIDALCHTHDDDDDDKTMRFVERIASPEILCIISQQVTELEDGVARDCMASHTNVMRELQTFRNNVAQYLQENNAECIVRDETCKQYEEYSDNSINTLINNEEERHVRDTLLTQQHHREHAEHWQSIVCNFIIHHQSSHTTQCYVNDDDDDDENISSCNETRRHNVAGETHNNDNNTFNVAQRQSVLWKLCCSENKLRMRCKLVIDDDDDDEHTHITHCHHHTNTDTSRSACNKTCDIDTTHCDTQCKSVKQYECDNDTGIHVLQPLSIADTSMIDWRHNTMTNNACNNSEVNDDNTTTHHQQIQRMKSKYFKHVLSSTISLSECNDNNGINDYCICREQCKHITVQRVRSGILQLTMKYISVVYDDDDDDDDNGITHSQTSSLHHHHCRWALNCIRQIHYRRYQLRSCAMELFFTNQTNCLLVFVNVSSRDIVYTRLMSLRATLTSLVQCQSVVPSTYLRQSSITDMWRRRHITNFDYLMRLNTIAGRTYNDLAQYPIFPWVLSNYSTSTLDLSDSRNYRDLSRPIGALNPHRLEGFAQRYRSLNDNADIPPFHYGTHYSTAGSVLFYLLRLEPFTSCNLALQGHQFDHADRLFDSIASTWTGCLTNPADVKELIPEFFYLPDFLRNVNKYSLGTKQTGSVVDHVILPAWASSPEHFIHQHRQALESEYVSNHLHEWIDLIFGYKQRGREAVLAHNVFFHLTYEGSVDIDSIEDPVLRDATIAQVEHFGQIPSQLLTTPHVKRCSLSDGDDVTFTLMNHLDHITLCTTAFIAAPSSSSPSSSSSSSSSSIRQQHILPELLDNPVVFISSLDKSCRVLTICLDRRIGLHRWKPTAYDTQPKFAWQTDRTSTAARILKTHFAARVSVRPTMFAVTSDCRSLITCGNFDSVLRIIDIDSGRVKQHIVAQRDTLTCMALDCCDDMSMLCTGSKDSTVYLWKLYRARNSYCIHPQPLHVLRGHSDEVSFRVSM